MQLYDTEVYTLPSINDLEGNTVTIADTTSTTLPFVTFSSLAMTYTIAPSIISQIGIYTISGTLSDINNAQTTYSFTLTV